MKLIMPKIFESPDKGETFTEREFTIEGRPLIKEPDVTDFNTKIFNQARRDRLSDIIGDYITDESTDAKTFYDELMAEISGWLEYHESYLSKCKTIKDLLQANRG